MTGWYESLARCLGDAELYDLIQVLHETGTIRIGSDHGLSEDQAISIYAYTLGPYRGGQSVFSATNSALRFGLALNEMAPYINVLLQAMRKMPHHVGVVTRRADLPQAMIETAQTSAVFSDRGFLSCSRKDDLNFGKDMLVIRSTCGRDISSLSAYPAEDEVAFLPGTQFEVTALEKHDFGCLMLLQEQ